MKVKKSIKEKFNKGWFETNSVLEDEIGFAALSHYLHNSTNGVSNCYKGNAISYVQEKLSQELNEEVSNQVAEETLQYMIFQKEESIPFPPPKNPKFTFIDLFAGIGGFRLALQNLGGKCVFTSEWDRKAKHTYKINFGELPFGDITRKDIKCFIPDKFDVLCAGFPCQPFSKGGYQNGFEDTRGTLFFDICEIVNRHKPQFLFLENVANLVTHDNKNTYKSILSHLDQLGYYFPTKPLILSPDQFGIPILRPRIYIPCVRKDIAKKDPEFIKNIDKQLVNLFKKTQPISSIIDNKNQESDLTEYELKVLHMWNDFYKNIDLKVIGFPVWADFFNYKGDFMEFPAWKANFVRKNTDLYIRNKSFIDNWFSKNKNLEWVKPTHRKLEWQAGTFHSDIFQGLIQFRPSGIRVKRATKFSTLVAMNHRQIIGPLQRKISLEEGKLTQSFPKDYILNPNTSAAFKQLGNSVNVYVVQIIFHLIQKKYL